MKDATIIKLWAVSFISGLEAINIIVMHADGAILAGVVGIIAGIAGYTIAKTNGGKK